MKRVATALAVLTLLTGCSKSKPASGTGSTTTSTSSVAIPTSTGATGTTATTKVAGISRLTTPEQASAHLFLAWQNSNRAEASQFASDTAVASLFAHPYTGPEPTFEGCEHQVDHYNCGYRYEGGAIIFRVEGGASAGYRVASVDFIAD